MSAVISGGTLIYTQSAVPGNGYDIALVNLSNNSLIWKKHSLVQHGNPANPGIYNGDWAKEAFSPFIHLTPPPPVTRVPEMNAEELLSTQDASLLRAEARALYAMAWFCRVLGQSGDGRYKSLLDDVAEEAVTRKLRRFAESGRDELPRGDVEQFRPGRRIEHENQSNSADY